MWLKSVAYLLKSGCSRMWWPLEIWLLTKLSSPLHVMWLVMSLGMAFRWMWQHNAAPYSWPDLVISLFFYLWDNLVDSQKKKNSSLWAPNWHKGKDWAKLLPSVKWRCWKLEIWVLGTVAVLKEGDLGPWSPGQPSAHPPPAEYVFQHWKEDTFFAY